MNRFSHDEAYMSPVMRKHIYVIICEQQRCKSAWAYTFWLASLLFKTFNCYIRHSKTLASFCSWTSWFKCYLIANLFSWCGSYWLKALLLPCCCEYLTSWIWLVQRQHVTYGLSYDLWVAIYRYQRILAAESTYCLKQVDRHDRQSTYALDDCNSKLIPKERPHNKISTEMIKVS